MANHEAYQKVFYPGRPHGIKGQIKYVSCYPFFEEIEELTTLFIQKAGTFLPYFIEEIQLLTDESCIISWEDCNNKETAMNFCKYDLFIPAEELNEYFDLEEHPFAGLKGYLCIDNKRGEIGQITDIEEFPGQYMAKISYKNKEIMIPLAAELILKTDDKKRELLVDLPEGFLEIFD